MLNYWLGSTLCRFLGAGLVTALLVGFIVAVFIVGLIIHGRP